MKKSNLTIGVLIKTYNSSSHKTIYGLSLSYMRFAEHVGEKLGYGKANVRLITPEQEPDELKDLNLLILPGGPDLSMALREEDASYIGQGADQTTFTAFYSSDLFQRWIDAGIPMFGICLGSQALAKHFDMDLETDGFNHQIDGTHYVIATSDKEVGVPNRLVNVNSRHHQFILPTNVPEDIIPMAYGYPYHHTLRPNKDHTTANILTRFLPVVWAPRTGRELSAVQERLKPSHIEAFRHRNLKIAAVQWHPEDLLYPIRDIGDELTWDLIKWLLSEPAQNIETLEPQEAPACVS